MTFEQIARAETTLNLRIEQVRNVLEVESGRRTWTSIRERLVVSPDPVSGDHRFVLDFVGLGPTAEATNTGTPQTGARLNDAARRELYRGYSGYLHLYANFRIDDPRLAAQNYSIVDLGSSVRLDRPTHRIALLPRRLGRNPWVLDVDVATSFPLFRAEFNAAGVLVSTLEVTRFEQVAPASVDGSDWWRPARRIEVFGSIQTALASLPLDSDPISPEASDLPAGYELAEVRVVHEVLRPEASLVLTYTDGIDEIFVLSTFGAPPPSLPAASGAGGAYAILYYQDLNVAQFMFYHDSVTTMVIGRAGQFALAGMAHDLLARSIGA